MPSVCSARSSPRRRNAAAHLKQVIEVIEVNTTRQCVHCADLTGPTGLKGLQVREAWTCSSCGQSQIRDRGAAWNILQVGRQKAAAQAVTGGQTSVARSPKGKGAQASRPGREVRKAPTARSKSDRVSVVNARGNPIGESSAGARKRRTSSRSGCCSWAVWVRRVREGSGRRSRSQKTMEVEQNHQPDEGALAVAEGLDGRCDTSAGRCNGSYATSQWLKGSMGAVTICTQFPD